MKALAIGVGMALAAAAPALAEIKVDFSGKTPVAASGLSSQGTCIPVSLKGKVATRTFDKGGVAMQSVVIEERSGGRHFLNVDTAEIAEASMADRSNANRALQILLKDGANVRVKAFACGAAGRVLMLESVRPQ
ncbi:hypothetical protein GCM10019059_32150 [Camelimonas fluminis]|nr:hypothetical protein GCM10019059_32150 [Camelimonas fluminis]